MERPDLNKLRILCYPDPRLRVRAKPIPQVESFLKEIVERMAELMREQHGVGLAATQVGWPYRLCLINTTLEPGKAQAFINPVIIAREGRMYEEEGCLSVPGVFAKVRRAERVCVRATLPDGESIEMQATGLIARAWQHELDHLDGALFLDRLSPAARIVVAPRLREMEQSFRRQGASGTE